MPDGGREFVKSGDRYFDLAALVSVSVETDANVLVERGLSEGRPVAQVRFRGVPDAVPLGPDATAKLIEILGSRFTVTDLGG